MIPALGDRLLPATAASLSQNAWLYSGELIGLPEPKLLHSCAMSGAAKVYRLPNSYGSPRVFDNSLWLEFIDRDTDVIRAPVVGDTFDRYYWVSPTVMPSYNTRDRIAFSQDQQSATVTANASTDTVAWTAHGLAAGDPVVPTSTGTVPGGLTSGTTYYVSSSGLTTDAFKLSTTPVNAAAGTSIDLTSAGTGTITMITGTKPAFTLGVPAPTDAPGVSVSGGSATVEARAYVVTWVSAYGEEGPPSPATLTTDHPDGTWTITLPTPDPSDRGITRNLTLARVYRTITSDSGVATFFLVQEVDISTTSVDDTADDTTISANTELASTDWSAPPDDLAGWVLMPNGIFAGWRSNELWFSEPYRPHAWPAKYAIAVDYPVVGLGVVNQTLVICTTGFPITATGVTPDAITTSKLMSFEQCISRGSILSAPEGVYYASPNGLILIVPGQATNITSAMVTKDKWQALTNLTQLRLARLGTGLYAYGSVGQGVFNQDAFETTAFQQEDTTGSHNGVFMDPNNSSVSLNTLQNDNIEALNVFNDPWSGELFLIHSGSPNAVYWIDTGDPTPTITPYIWRSKVFQAQYAANLAAMRIFFSVPPETPDQNPVQNVSQDQTLADDQYGLVRVYADGVLKMTREIRTSGEIMKMPSGFKADYWQFEIEARVRIFSLEAASSEKELRLGITAETAPEQILA